MHGFRVIRVAFWVWGGGAVVLQTGFLLPHLLHQVSFNELNSGALESLQLAVGSNLVPSN